MHSTRTSTALFVSSQGVTANNRFDIFFVIIAFAIKLETNVELFNSQNFRAARIYQYSMFKLANHSTILAS